MKLPILSSLICSVLLFCNLAVSLELKSPVIQGAMIIGKTEAANGIRVLKRNARVNAQGYFVFGLGRDAASQVTVYEILPSGTERAYTFDVVQRTYNEQRIDGVPNRTVNTPESALPRIRQEVRLSKAARKVESDRQDFLQTFQWPTPGIITGVYGSRRVYNGQPRRPHYGIDIAAPTGTPVLAPVAGQVTLVHNDMYFSGGTLIIDHGHGVSSTFIHLSKILVTEGQTVKQGEAIAEVGASGRATGPHLDWRMNWFDQRLDPQLLMDTLPEKLNE